MKDIAKKVFSEYSEESIELRMVLPLRWEDLYSGEKESFVKIVELVIREYVKEERK